MRKKKTIQLSEAQRMELENGYRNSQSHAFRQRCQMILLKSGNRSSVVFQKCVC